MKEGYRRSRAALLARLPEIGFDELLPVDGAFYVYASVARFTNDALDFAGRMLREAGVAATPGPDFDHARGHRYMRFSFAGTEADIVEGIERLGALAEVAQADGRAVLAITCHVRDTRRRHSGARG